MKKTAIKPRFAAAKAGKTLELLVYTEIGLDWWNGEGCTALDVAAAIKAEAGFSDVVVRINSPGGDCFEGVTIYNLLRSLKVPVAVYVDGIAASAASVVAMAGDTINMGTGAMLMVHNAAWGVFGDAGALRKAADVIENVSVTVGGIYVERTGNDAATIKEIMDAETWMGAKEAVEKGFATAAVAIDDAIAVPAQALAQRFNLKGFKHPPATLGAGRGVRHESVNPDCECPCDACTSDGCEGCTHDPCTEEGCTCPNSEEMKAEFTPSIDFYRQRLYLHQRTA